MYGVQIIEKRPRFDKQDKNSSTEMAMKHGLFFGGHLRIGQSLVATQSKMTKQFRYEEGFWLPDVKTGLVQGTGNILLAVRRSVRTHFECSNEFDFEECEGISSSKMSLGFRNFVASNERMNENERKKANPIDAIKDRHRNSEDFTFRVTHNDNHAFALSLEEDFGPQQYMLGIDESSIYPPESTRNGYYETNADQTLPEKTRTRSNLTYMPSNDKIEQFKNRNADSNGDCCGPSCLLF